MKILRTIFGLLLFFNLSNVMGERPLMIYVDESSQKNVDQLNLNQFQNYTPEKGALGFSSSTIWLLVKNGKIKNESEYLELRNPYLEQIEKFVLRGENWKWVEKKGALIADKKINREKYFYFELSEDYELYKITSENLLTLHAKVLNEYEYERSHLLDCIVLVFFYLFIIIAFFLNLQFNANRYTPTAKAYTAFLISTSFHVLITTGIVYLLPIRGTFIAEYIIGFSAAILIFTYFRFTRLILSINELSVWLKKVFDITNIIFIVGCLVFFVFSKVLFFKWINVAALMMVFLTATSAIIAWKKGVQPARYFLFGWACFLLAVVLDMLFNLGVITLTFSVNYIAIAGAALQSLFFTWSLAVNFKELLKDHEEMKRIMTQLKSQIDQNSAAIKNDHISVKDLNEHLNESLSNREIEVLELLIRDFTYIEIADRLFISKNTVKTHLRKCYQKLGVSNRKEVLPALEKKNIKRKEAADFAATSL